MDIIWNQDSHTQPLATMPFISTRVGVQQQSGCAIDLESLGIRHRQKRLISMRHLYESGVFFRFHKLSFEFGSSRTRSVKRNIEEQEVEMDIIWNQDSHTQPLATMPSISTRVGLQQQSGCANDFLGIRQRQKRLFNLDAAFNLGFLRFALGYDRSLQETLFFTNEAI